MDDLTWEAFRPDVVAIAVRPPAYAKVKARARRRRRQRAGFAMSTAVAAVAVIAAVPIVNDWRRPDMSAGDDPHIQAAFDTRAVATVDAWNQGGMDYVSRLGFVPRADLSVLAAAESSPTSIADTFPSTAAWQAFTVGRFRLANDLAEQPPGPGTITFPDASTVSVPLASAAATFRAMDHSDDLPAAGEPPTRTGQGFTVLDPSCVDSECLTLTVTGASLGVLSLRTSRGVAKVPMWIFTVQELKAPVARVAVAASESGAAALRLPKEVLAASQQAPSGSFHDLDSLSTQGPSSLDLTLGFFGTICDIIRAGHVYETAAVVVVTVHTESSSPNCAGTAATVTVQLAAPLASRMVLSLTTGEPVGLPGAR